MSARATGAVIGLVGPGAVSSLALPVIHVNEVDVTPGGFRQDHFTVRLAHLLQPGLDARDRVPRPVRALCGRAGRP
ncbi:hypothetical protein ACPPVO_30345 [Dactylosporangium sp. McL0621]|uniref:hypothetical protein n=1 Tax=Dactylosporangium sp. McL0621 TaxID=3415678 RepID=UPI003CEA764E